MVDLEPLPEALASLLLSMTEIEWPTTEADRVHFFEQFGLHDVGVLRPDPGDPDTSWGKFSVDLSSNVSGSSTMFRGEFLMLALFCYDEQLENGRQARAGYDALREQLRGRLGPPEEDWGSPTEPVCAWRIGPLALDIYCFQRLRSNIMITLDHAARSEAGDEAHPDRPVAEYGELEP